MELREKIAKVLKWRNRLDLDYECLDAADAILAIPEIRIGLQMLASDSLACAELVAIGVIESSPKPPLA